MDSRVKSRHERRAGNGRFEILPELAILTSDILGSDSGTALVEKPTRPRHAATSVTRRSAGPHPAVTRRPNAR
jgi:hypothetical protein